MIGLKKYFKNCINFCGEIKFRLLLNIAHHLNGNLAILISSAYWGNVGDHAIVLSEKNILREAGLRKKTIDIDSNQFIKYFNTIVKYVHPNDLIIIDGGGNFGDVWPETQMAINKIVDVFKENQILVFPESWYFADSTLENRLLVDTIKTIQSHNKIIIFARDSYSYRMMKKYLPGVSVKLSLDVVFMLPIEASEKSGSGVAIVIRDDKESINIKFSKKTLEDEISKLAINTFEIRNDCYKHIGKNERKQYVSEIIEQYMKADAVITDRFHGFVLSVMCKKPCIILDNKTGKIGNFYKDICKHIQGVLYADKDYTSVDDIKAFLRSLPKVSVDDAFKCQIKNDKKFIIKTIIRLMETK